jgi:hypothetical protein
MRVPRARTHVELHVFMRLRGAAHKRAKTAQNSSETAIWIGSGSAGSTNIINTGLQPGVAPFGRREALYNEQ